MPPLPPGEAVRAQHWEVFGARARFPPRTAPGYSRAAAMGLLPPAPADRPPAPVPGLSAWDRLRLGLVSFFGLVPGVWATAERLDPGTPAVLLSVVPAGAAMWFFYSTTRRSRLEHEAGYTSGPDTVGLWRLARDGRVLRTPDTSVPRPASTPRRTTRGCSSAGRDRGGRR